jgi:hypothetical protein
MPDGRTTRPPEPTELPSAAASMAFLLLRVAGMAPQPMSRRSGR